MANTGQIIKSKTTNKYTTIPNEIIYDKSLTLDEKGLLIYLLSLPCDWVLYKKNLYNNLNDKRGAIDRAFKNLQDKGYIISVKVLNEKAQFVGWNHVVYDEPAQEKPKLGKHDLGLYEKPTLGFTELGENTPILNTNNILSTKEVLNTKEGELFFSATNEEKKTQDATAPDLPFGEDFKTAWEEWLMYRKSAKFKKYTEIGLKKTFKDLIKISGNSEENAVLMLERAISNNWQGFNFKLPDNGTNKQNTGSSKQQAASSFLEQSRERYRLITGGS